MCQWCFFLVMTFHLSIFEFWHHTLAHELYWVKPYDPPFLICRLSKRLFISIYQPIKYVRLLIGVTAWKMLREFFCPIIVRRDILKQLYTLNNVMPCLISTSWLRERYYVRFGPIIVRRLKVVWVQIDPGLTDILYIPWIFLYLVLYCILFLSSAWHPYLSDHR
jgi:hypothetical protein